VAYENSKNPYVERREWVNGCLKLSKLNLVMNVSIKKRAREREKEGIKPIDALHLACAELGKVDYFITCDDKVIKRYVGGKMSVFNPVEFILKVTEEGNHEHSG